MESTNQQNLAQAFKIAEEVFGVPQILDPEDIDVERPDEKSVMMYVAEIIKVWFQIYFITKFSEILVLIFFESNVSCRSAKRNICKSCESFAD